MGEELPVCKSHWIEGANFDCFFLVGLENGPLERVGAKKTLILMRAGEPFKAMVQKRKPSETGDIRVSDMEPEIFRIFLKCVYGESSFVIPKLSLEENLKLLYAVQKYLIDDYNLVSDLSQHMYKLLSPENVWIALSYPVFYEPINFLFSFKIRDILKYQKSFEGIAKDDNFLEIRYSAIEWILKLTYIPVKEIEMWNAVLRWAKHQTGSNDGKVLRSTIFGLLKYIRFLAMDHKEFWEDVVSSGILLEPEVNDICRALVSGKPCNTEYLCQDRQDRYCQFQEWYYQFRPVSEYMHSSFLDTPKYAFIRCLVKPVSDFPTNSQYSTTYSWAKQFWNISLKRGHHLFLNDSLDVSVSCRRNGTPSLNCDLEMSLVNQSGQPDIIRKFTLKSGFVQWLSGFCNWDYLLNPANGFVKDDSFVFVVRVELKNT